MHSSNGEEVPTHPLRKVAGALGRGARLPARCLKYISIFSYFTNVTSWEGV